MVQRLYNYGVTMSYCVHAVALSLGRDCDGVEDGSPEGCPDYACSILRVKGYSTGKVSFDAIARTAHRATAIITYYGAPNSYRTTG